MTAPIPRRLAPIAKSATLELFAVLGGDALSHRHGRALASRWSPDETRFAALFAPAEDSDEDRCTIVEFDARGAQSARSVEAIEPDTRAFALSPDGEHALLLRDKSAAMRSLTGGADAALPCATELYENTRVARFSPDGSYALYATHRAALYLARTSPSREWTATRVPEGQHPFALSSDGDRYAHGSAHARITVARASDGAALRTIEAPGEPLVALRFSASGALLIAAHRDGTVRCIELETGRERWCTAHARRVRDVGVDEESARVWLCVDSSRELALDLQTGAAIEDRRLKLDPDLSAPDVYAPSGRRALSVWDRELAIVDCRSASPADVHDGHSGAITAIAASPDGAQLATSSADATVRTWRARDGALLWVLGEPDARRGIVEASYLEDAPALLTRGGYNDLRLWDARTGVELDPGPAPYASAMDRPLEYPHTFFVAWCAPIVASADYVLAGPASSSDYSSSAARWRILRYDPTRGEVRWKHTDNRSRDSLFALSPDGTTLVQCLRSGERRLFATRDGAQIDAPLTASEGRVDAITFTRGGALIVCDQLGVGWHRDARAPRQSCSNERWSGPIAATHRGDRVAGVDPEGRVVILGIEDGAVLDVIDVRAADDQCTALAWVDEDQALAIGTKRQLVLLYRASR